MNKEEVVPPKTAEEVLFETLKDKISTTIDTYKKDDGTVNLSQIEKDILKSLRSMEAEVKRVLDTPVMLTNSAYTKYVFYVQQIETQIKLATVKERKEIKESGFLKEKVTIIETTKQLPIGERLDALCGELRNELNIYQSRQQEMLDLERKALEAEQQRAKALEEENKRLSSQLILNQKNLKAAETIINNTDLGHIGEETAKKLIEALRILNLQSSINQNQAQTKYLLEEAKEHNSSPTPLPEKYKVTEPNKNNKNNWTQEEKSRYDQFKLSGCVSPAKYAAICELVWFINKYNKNNSAFYPNPPDIEPAKACIYTLLSEDNWKKGWQESYNLISAQIETSKDLQNLNLNKFDKYSDTLPNAYGNDKNTFTVLANIIGLGHFIPKNIDLGQSLQKIANEPGKSTSITNSLQKKI